MGRTNTTYPNFFEAFEDDFSDYQRALRRQHQADFDRPFDGAHKFADAAGHANHLDRNTLALMSICHAQQYQISDLEERVDELEAALSER